MSWIFTGIAGISILFSILAGRGGELAAAIPKGAQSGITLAVSMAGGICLWSGVGKLMDKAGFTAVLSRLLRPLLSRVFPSTKTDPVLAGTLSANICANFFWIGQCRYPHGHPSCEAACKRP